MDKILGWRHHGFSRDLTRDVMSSHTLWWRDGNIGLSKLFGCGRLKLNSMVEVDEAVDECPVFFNGMVLLFSWNHERQVQEQWNYDNKRLTKVRWCVFRARWKRHSHDIEILITSLLFVCFSKKIHVSRHHNNKYSEC